MCIYELDPQTTIEPLKDLLSFGFPKEHIFTLAKKHLCRLEELDDNIRFKKCCIEATQNFIKELNINENDN